MVEFGDGGDLPGFEEPAAVLDVRHDHVDRLLPAQRAEALDPEQELAAGHALLDAALDRLRRGDIGGRDRLLVPGELLGFEAASDIDSQVDVEEAVAIDQDVHVGATGRKAAPPAAAIACRRVTGAVVARALFIDAGNGNNRPRFRVRRAVAGRAFANRTSGRGYQL